MKEMERYKIALEIDTLLKKLERARGLNVDEQYSVKDTRKAVDQLLYDTKPSSVRMKESMKGCK